MSVITANVVPTTCTAVLLTGWAEVEFEFGKGTGNNRKTNVKKELKFVKDLIEGSFYRSHKMIHAFITNEEIENYRTDKLLTKLGFELVFEGPWTGKTFPQGNASDRLYSNRDEQRHEETGSLFLWACTPEKYQESLENFKKELEAELLQIDPPKKPDPARLAMPELKKTGLIKSGIIAENSYVDNGIHAVLKVTPEVAYRHIKLTYGIDIKKWKNYGDGWTKITIRQLKEAHTAWKEEPVV
jgi:hypothetical protein